MNPTHPSCNLDLGVIGNGTLAALIDHFVPSMGGIERIRSTFRTPTGTLRASHAILAGNGAIEYA